MHSTKYDWKNFKILKQYGPLILGYQMNNVEQIYYEIIYRKNKTFNLWGTEHEEQAISQFNCLENIVSKISQSNLNRPKSVKLLQNLIKTMNDHPNWLEVHIAAYNGLVEYFRQPNFNIKEINTQKDPDYYTPLHLAVMQQFRLTVKQIIQFNPKVNLVDYEKNTVLHIAAKVNIEIFKLLLNGANYNDNIKALLKTKNNQNLNPIEIVCLNSQKEHLIHLMKLGLTSRMLSIVNDKNFLSTFDDDPVVPFENNDFTMMNFNRIDLGGCPLHWSNKPEAIKKFLHYFDKETPNLKNETPLMVMVKNDNFHCALYLMFHGADVNRPDSNGDSPLHVAVMRTNILLIKSLIIFDSNVNALNSKDLDPSQWAHNQDPNLYKEIIELFNSYNQTQKKNDRISEEDTFFDCELQMKRNEYPNKPIINESISRLICLDGGGVKGLFTVQMMIELQKYLKRELITYFDWIAGTSTGSMIAFAMTNRKTLFELRRLYFIFKDEILKGNRPYNTENLENLFIKELEADIPLKDVWELHRKHLIITASRVDCYPPKLQLFCSHGQTASNVRKYPSDILVWQALRASCAAPTYFHHYLPYIDGGLISNNPTLDSLTEFFRYQRQQKSDNQLIPKLELVLSFGTGSMKPQTKNFSHIFDKFNYLMDFRSFVRDINRSPWIFGNELASHMKNQVTNCNDHIVNRSAVWCRCLDILFFRINSIFSKKVALNESRDEELITALWDVKLYCYQMSDSFKKIAQILDKN